MNERQSSQDEIDSIHTVYLSEEHYQRAATLFNRDGLSTSALIRQLFQLYLKGKYKAPAPTRTDRKTTVWADAKLWAQVRAKAAEERTTVKQVIASGFDYQIKKRKW